MALAAGGAAPSLWGQSSIAAKDAEIRLGTTLPLTGPVASYAAVGQAAQAYFATINASGGVNGRKLRLVLADDEYSPERSLEQTRRLVEREQVLAMVGQVGTATALATRAYLNDARVPQLFVGSGALTWSRDIARYPWSLAWLPSIHLEGETIGRHILSTRPWAKVGALYQNDDGGRAYLSGLKSAFAANPRQLVREEAVEAADPSIDAQVTALHASGADVMASYNIPRATVQALRRAFDLSWRPEIYIASVSTSVPRVLLPAGAGKSKGVFSATYMKDPSDPAWADDRGMQDFVAMMKAQSPDTSLDIGSVNGASIASTTVQLLRQCGADLSRENILAQTMRLDMPLPLVLPGLRIHTTPSQRSLFSAMRLQQFDGTRWSVVPTG